MNGSDAQSVDVYAFGAAAAIERGWNALIFEGPGQGPMLFEREIPFRLDWEKVITPIIDFLSARPDVDAVRIALTGWSLGGALVTRAATFEKRLAAVCADPGFVSTWDTYPMSLRGLFANGATEAQVNTIWRHDVIPALSPQGRFTLAKRSEIYGPQYLDAARAGQVFADLWSFGQTVMQFQVADVAARVAAPMLVTQYEHDQFFPSGGKHFYDLLTCPKTLVTFTAAEHDAPLAPQQRNQIVFDWLDATLGIRDCVRPKPPEAVGPVAWSTQPCKDAVRISPRDPFWRQWRCPACCSPAQDGRRATQARATRLSTRVTTRNRLLTSSSASTG